LALDGGGIRGLLTLGILEKLEADLRAANGGSASFRLCDYFDFIGGTSTGAWSKYSSDPLEEKLKSVFGEKTGLGSDMLKTLLLVVMRNVTTDSPWPVTNNPYAKYNSRVRPDCNLDLPLWQLVRASTAAPTFFPPELVRLRTWDKF
jgi:patatin-like phospholipase/acyl hydrolase